MLHEHVLGRDCVARMREASQAQPFDAHTFSDAARQYIPLLRQHIFKENNVLFRMAERVLPGRAGGIVGQPHRPRNDPDGWLTPCPAEPSCAWGSGAATWPSSASAASGRKTKKVASGLHQNGRTSCEQVKLLGPG